MKAALPRVAALEAALPEAKHRLAAGAAAGAMQALERAHVLGQAHFGPHLKAHRGMRHVGFTSRNWRDVRDVCDVRDVRDVRGQIMWTALVR